MRTFSKSGSVFPKSFSADGKEPIVFDAFYESKQRSADVPVVVEN
jgi:hypothetical protein